MPNIAETVAQFSSTDTLVSNETVQEVKSLAESLGLDVREYNNWGAIVDKSVLEGISIEEVKSAINILNATTSYQKKYYDTGDEPRFIEIRPPLKRTPNEIPIYVEMVDSQQNTCLFEAQDGTKIQALKMSPNPSSLIINSSKIVNRYNTMTRWVEEHWGDEVDTVTISGSTFSFMCFQPMVGLSVINRNDTAPYLYMRELIKFYRTNGCLFHDNTYDTGDQGDNFEDSPTNTFLKENPSFIDNHPLRGFIKERMYIRITLDYISFLGYFDNFDLIEEANNPYRFTYNATFKSERTKLIFGV